MIMNPIFHEETTYLVWFEDFNKFINDTFFNGRKLFDVTESCYGINESLFFGYTHYERVNVNGIMGQDALNEIDKYIKRETNMISLYDLVNYLCKTHHINPGIYYIQIEI